MIGNLKKRITIQEQIRTLDGGGGFTEVWQNIATTPNVYASIEPISADEQLRFYQLKEKVTHRIIVRYRNDLTSDMRILHGAVVYEINTLIDKNGREEYLKILATVEG